MCESGIAFNIAHLFFVKHGDKMMRNIVSSFAIGMLLATTAYAQSSTSSTSSSAQAGALSDPQIAAIVVAADNADINAGKLASSKASNADVKAFANRMVADHTSVNKSASALAAKLKISPEESATSKSLKDDGESALKKLKGLSGSEFDKAYVDNEVTLHQKVLDSIDKTLLPNAKNPELKSLITQTRPVIEDHLQHAKKIQSAMK
jgi:putative membrane protein